MYMLFGLILMQVNSYSLSIPKIQACLSLYIRTYINIYIHTSNKHTYIILSSSRELAVIKIYNVFSINIAVPSLIYIFKVSMQHFHSIHILRTTYNTLLCINGCYAQRIIHLLACYILRCVMQSAISRTIPPSSWDVAYLACK